MAREARPNDADYYEAIFRSDLLSQGDLFANIPCGYPCSPKDLADPPGARRLFLSGPLPPGFAMLVTPSCSMGGEPTARTNTVVYDHPVRCLVPLLPTTQFQQLGILSEQQLEAARRHDDLINYMYLPGHEPSGMPDSLALLYLPLPFDHELLMVTGDRVAQLALEGARQLARKLSWFWSSAQINREAFSPALD